MRISLLLWAAVCQQPSPFGHKVIFVTDEAFVGANIDWWRNNDPVYGPKFGFAGALTVNLTHPSLLAVARGLSPGILRIGGTPADGIVYGVHGGECANVSVDPEPTCTPTPGAYSCDKCGDRYGCLKWDRWVELLRFANTTGMKLVFGLNGCRGRKKASSEMDWSNVVALLNKTANTQGLGSLLHGVELGNELIKGFVNTGQMSKDFIKLKQLVTSIWDVADPTGLTLSAPLVAGADESRNMGEFLQGVGAGVLDAATWHMYGQCGHDNGTDGRTFPPVSAPGFALLPSCLSQGGAEAGVPAIQKIVADNAPAGTKSWIGESALTGGGAQTA